VITYYTEQHAGMFFIIARLIFRPVLYSVLFDALKYLEVSRMRHIYETCVYVIEKNKFLTKMLDKKLVAYCKMHNFFNKQLCVFFYQFIHLIILCIKVVIKI